MQKYACQLGRFKLAPIGVESWGSFRDFLQCKTDFFKKLVLRDCFPLPFCFAFRKLKHCCYVPSEMVPLVRKVQKDFTSSFRKMNEDVFPSWAKHSLENI